MFDIRGIWEERLQRRGEKILRTFKVIHMILHVLEGI